MIFTERENLVYQEIKEKFSMSTTVFVDFIENFPKYKSILNKLENAGVVQYSHVDNMVSYMLTGSFELFEFETKEREEMLKENHNMKFEYLSNASEEVLHKIINGKYHYEQNQHNNNIISDLVVKRKITAQKLSSANYIDKFFDILPNEDGNSYFEMKLKYEDILERTRPMIINASNNSAVNITTGSGNATQTIDYANNEQLNALTNLASMVNSTSKFTDDEKTEIIELIEGAKEATTSNKKTMLKTLCTGISSVLTKAPAFILDKWEEIKTMFEV